MLETILFSYILCFFRFYEKLLPGRMVGLNPNLAKLLLSISLHYSSSSETFTKSRYSYCIEASRTSFDY